MNWSKVMKEIKIIQSHLNEGGTETSYYYSIGNVFMILENSCIGKCDATLNDYQDAISDFWLLQKEGP